VPLIVSVGERVTYHLAVGETLVKFPDDTQFVYLLGARVYALINRVSR
jgi:hypothetical protein